MEFSFVSLIYALACGHDASVRATRVAEPGEPWHCAACDCEQPVADVVLFA